MKNRFFLLLCLCLTTFSSYASWSKADIRINDQKKTEDTVHSLYYDVIVERGIVENDGSTIVTISIQNNHPTSSLFLFGSPLSKKELRTQHGVIVRKDGCQQMLKNKYCELVSNRCRIEPQTVVILGKIKIKVGEEKGIDLPIYIAKKQALCSKMLIHDWDELELTIKIEEEPNPEYNRLEEESRELITEISEQTFCKHKSHRPKLNEQKEPYIIAIIDLQDEILDKKAELPKYSNYREKYDLLWKQLNEIDLSKYESYCEKHSGIIIDPPIHHCKYCNKTLEEIGATLDNLYKRLDLGKIEKKDAVNEVNMIQKCLKSNSKLASEWKSCTTGYKKSIEELCNKIKNN